MENQSPTQQTLSEEQRIRERTERKKNSLKVVKDNLNYIYIVLMVIANCIISLLKIENGKIGLNYPDSALGWILWATQIIVTTFIGVMILGAFRRQGIKNGHEVIKDTYDEYLKVVANDTNNKNPRSLTQYMRSQTIRDSVTKAPILIMLSLLVVSLSISGNLNALLALVVNIIFAISFGIKAMLDAEEYVVQELIIWYKIRIKELQNIEKEKEIKNERRLSRNKQPRPRPSKPSGIQQAKECHTGLTNSDLIQSSECTFGTSSSGLPS